MDEEPVIEGRFQMLRGAFRAGVVLSLLFVAGCALLPRGDDPMASEGEEFADAALDVEPGEDVSGGAPLPDVELTPEILYYTLLGEIAGQRGYFDVSSEALLDAAIASGDRRLARRAASISLFAQQYDIALAAASLWVELEPDDPIAREALGVSWLALAQPERAEEQFVAMLERVDDDDLGRVYRRLADQLARHGEPAEALPLLERLIEPHQNIGEAHFARAFLAERYGDPVAVLDAIERALAVYPDWEDAAVIKLDALGQLGLFEQADAFAVSFMRSAPAVRNARIQYARLLLGQGREDEALAQFRELLRHHPDDADATFAAAMLAVQVQRYDDAEGFLLRVLELRPDNDQARLYLGQLAAEQGRYDEAVGWYNEITQPTLQFEAQLLTGAALAGEHDTDQALAHLKGLVPITDEQALRLFLRKEDLLRSERRFPEAREVLDEAIEQFPDNPDLLYARGLIFALMGEIDSHERDMRRLIEIDPDNAHAFNALGYTLTDQTERHDEAYDLIARALELRPDDPFILDSMGWVYYRLGNNELALSYLERAFDGRQDAEIAAHLGEVLWMIGHRERAREIWDIAIENEPDNPVLQETLERFGP